MVIFLWPLGLALIAFVGVQLNRRATGCRW
jgi:hypothetical protein